MVVAKSKDILNGMNEICAYVGWSAPTVLKWIRHSGFPARQDGPNGTWRSSKRLADEWNEKRISGTSRTGT